MNVRIEVPRAVLALVERLEGAGFETWVVGGAVRDAIAGRSVRGRVVWDLATAATPAEMRGLFRRTVPLGVEYGTVGVFGRDGLLHEATTFRRDVATYGRKATVEFGRSLADDLARRDFTVNAIAWHPLRKALCDPYGGCADLAGGVLRAVGDPAARFREDYLRVLRGFRFAGTMGLAVDPGTWAGMVDAVPGLSHLSVERVREELMKSLAGPKPSRALALYRDSGALRHLAPELKTPPTPAALAAVDAGRACRPVLRMATLLLFGLSGDANSALAAAALLRRLRFSNAESARIRGAMAGGLAPSADLRADKVTRRRWAATAGRAGVRDVFRVWLAALRAGSDCPGALDVVRKVRHDMRTGVPTSASGLAVGGRDLIARGWKPGPRIGRTLARLLEAVWEDPSLNERTRLLSLAGEPKRSGSP